MPNPIFSMFGNQQPPLQNATELMSRFNQFKSTFSGDPQQKVQELLQSGQMTQEQFNALSRFARQYQGLFK